MMSFHQYQVWWLIIPLDFNKEYHGTIKYELLRQKENSNLPIYLNLNDIPELQIAAYKRATEPRVPCREIEVVTSKVLRSLIKVVNQCKSLIASNWNME